MMMQTDWNARSRRHPLLMLLLINALAGAAAAAVFLAALIVFDIARIGTLINGSGAPIAVTFLLYSVLVVTFSSAAMGSAIMRLGRSGSVSRPGGGHRATTPAAILAPVPVPNRH